MSGRSTPRASSPRGGGRTPRGPLSLKKQSNTPAAQPRRKENAPKPSPFHALPAESTETEQEAQEAALAASLLQEALRGTPRPSQRHQAELPARHQPITVGTSPKHPEDVDEGEGEDEDEDDGPPLIPERLMARRRLKDAPDAPWMYLVRFQGLGREDDHWVPESDLDPTFIASELAAAEAERQQAVE